MKERTISVLDSKTERQKKSQSIVPSKKASSYLSIQLWE
jgi:hypothetical protein